MALSLENLKVLDLSMNLPGPYMTWLLATMGAEVVKVENPVGGDYARVLGGASGGKSPFFNAVNRNKKSVALNLKHPKAKRIFLELLDVYDVLVEGFRPGAMERLGLGYEELSAQRPGLVQVSISGYGQQGPYRLRAGHDVNYLSLAGIINMNGTRAGDPAICGIQIADLAGGSLMSLVGLLAAVIHRQSTGLGQLVDASMFHGSLSLATMVLAGVEFGLDKPGPAQMVLNGRSACYQLYKTSDGRYMSLGAVEPKFWENFCKAVGREDLVPDQWAGAETIDEVAKIFAARTQAEWAEFMKDHDACCEPVIELTEALDSDLVGARTMVETGPDGYRTLGSPLVLSGSPAAESTPAPELGEHTREILTKVGVSPEELDELATEGAI